MINKPTCACIIPFYNEGERVVQVVEMVTKVKNLSQIIVADDGSDSDDSYQKLKQKFPQLTLIRLPHNVGKPNAIKAGLKQIKAEYILILDGDLTIFHTEQIDNAIKKITSIPQIDLIVLRRVADATSLAWLRQDIVTSGQRILRKSDLENVFKKKYASEQLEFTMNEYMIENHKLVYWMPFTIHNIWRHNKWGRNIGINTYLKASLINSKIGWHKVIWQTLTFCRREAP